MEFIQNVSVFEEYTSFGEQKRIPELNKKLHPCGEAIRVVIMGESKLNIKDKNKTVSLFDK